MSAGAGTTVAEAADRLAGSKVRSLRRGCLAAFVLLVVQYALGMYVNLYVTLPEAGNGGSFGKAMTSGGGVVIVHAAVGVLLILAAAGFAVQALLARQAALIAAGAAGFLAMLGAAGAGSGFVSSGGNGASLVMALLTAVALLCYGYGLYLLPRPAPGS